MTSACPHCKATDCDCGKQIAALEIRARLAHLLGIDAPDDEVGAPIIAFDDVSYECQTCSFLKDGSPSDLLGALAGAICGNCGCGPMSRVGEDDND